MLLTQFGDFIWSAWPPDMQAIKPSLYQLWFDNPPSLVNITTWPMSRDKLVYGSNGTAWGWYIDTAIDSRGYICQSSVNLAKTLLPHGRTIDYGQNDTISITRGPCFVEQPTDAW